MFYITTFRISSVFSEMLVANIVGVLIVPGL